MYCQHLSCYTPVNKTWSVASCQLNGIPYVPSKQELERYCKTGGHHQCPLLFQSLPGAASDAYLWPELKVMALAQCR